jgi:ketosteroid isomerase-like protein
VSTLTAQENAELIREGYEAFSKGDIPAVVALWADDIAWHVPGRNPLAGDYTGAQEILGFFGQLQERSGGSFRLEIHDVLATDDHVVALVSAIADRGDKSMNIPGAHIWHVRDGRATEFWGATYDQYATDEFWS